MSHAIAKTRFHTPLNAAGAVDICDGRPLFHSDPWLPRIGGHWESKPLEFAPWIGLYRLRYRAAASLYYGFCGPSYAIDLTLFGTESGDTLTLACEKSRAVAGLTWGMSLRLSLGMEFQLAVPELHRDGWSVHLGLHTLTLTQQSLDLTFDLIDVLLNYFLEKKKLNVVKDKGVGASLFAVDESELQGDAAKLAPSFTVSVDFSDAIPGLKGFKDTVKKVTKDQVAFSAGIDLRLSLPTTVKLVEAETNGAKYSLKADRGQLTGTRTPSASSDVPANGLAVTLQHDSGIGIGVGVSTSLLAFKVVSLSYGVTIPFLNDILKIPSIWSYRHRFTADASAGLVADVGTPRDVTAYEVFFEEPEAVGA